MLPWRRSQHIAEVAKDHAAGVFSGTNDLVKITGKEPIGLREFVEKNKRLFDGFVAKGAAVDDGRFPGRPGLFSLGRSRFPQPARRPVRITACTKKS